MDVGAAARRAVVQLAVSRLLSLVAMLAGLTVLARLLDPAEFGIYAMAFAGIGVARAVVEAGFLQDAIRRETPMRDETLALAALMSLGLSLLVAGIVLGGGALLPPAMRPEGMLEVLAPMLAVLPLIALTLPREARLHRAVAFDVSARAGIAGAVSEVAVAIALAWWGFGAMALAWGFAAGQVGRAATLLALSEPTGPARPRLGEGRELLRFGLRVVSVSLWPKVVDLVLLGALGVLAGAAVTGLFDRAQKLNRTMDDTLLNGLRPMMLPLIAGTLRDGRSPAEVVAVKHDYLMPIAFAGFGGIALLAGPLVSVLLGPGWEAAVTPLRILALGGLAMPVTKMAQKLFVAIGDLAAFGRIQTVQLVLRAGLGLAGAAISLEAFCAAIAATNLLKAALILRWEHVHAGAPLAAILPPARRALAVAAGALALPALLLWSGALPDAATLALSVAWALPAWLTGLRLTGHPLAAEIGAVWRGRPLLRR